MALDKVQSKQLEEYDRKLMEKKMTIYLHNYRIF